MTASRLVSLLFAGLCLGLVLSVLPVAQAVEPEAADDDLGQLKKSMKKSATTDDLVQYLMAVASNYKKAKGPEKPEGDDPALLKQYQAEVKKHQKWLEGYRADAEKAFLKALTLVKIQHENNVRVEANLLAAKILGELPLPKPPEETTPDEEMKAWKAKDEKFRKDLSKKIMQAIEKKLTKVKTHDVSTDLLDGVFAALGKLNDESALLWMAKEYSHTIDTKKEYLVAAHKAMVMFTNVRGKIRYDIVSEFVKQYASVELQAEKSDSSAAIQAKKRFWDFIKTHTIPVVQHFAGKPVDSEDQALAEMKQFQDWMRDHKNPRKAPWIDEKIK